MADQWTAVFLCGYMYLVTTQVVKLKLFRLSFDFAQDGRRATYLLLYLYVSLREKMQVL